MLNLFSTSVDVCKKHKVLFIDIWFIRSTTLSQEYWGNLHKSANFHIFRQQCSRNSLVGINCQSSERVTLLKAETSVQYLPSNILFIWFLDLPHLDLILFWETDISQEALLLMVWSLIFSSRTWLTMIISMRDKTEERVRTWSQITGNFQKHCFFYMLYTINIRLTDTEWLHLSPQEIELVLRLLQIM